MKHKVTEIQDSLTQVQRERHQKRSLSTSQDRSKRTPPQRLSSHLTESVSFSESHNEGKQQRKSLPIPDPSVIEMAGSSSGTHATTITFKEPTTIHYSSGVTMTTSSATILEVEDQSQESTQPQDQQQQQPQQVPKLGLAASSSTSVSRPTTPGTTPREKRGKFLISFILLP